ncbi:hypothetical protein EBR16_03910, partial [bacterium]|nr:hypothetical protein [bacterium]
TLASIASTAGFALGQAIAGAGVPNGTYITALTPTTVTLSNNLTAAASASYTAYPTIGGTTGVLTPTSISAFVPHGQTGMITANIGGTGALVKSGQGNLLLESNTSFNPATNSTFSGGVTLTEGVLTLAGNTVVDANNSVVSGPLGTGTLTIDPVSIYTWLNATPSYTQYYGGQATLYRTVANPIVVKGDFQFASAAVDLMLTGPASFPGAARTIIPNQNTLAFWGPLSGTATITRLGGGSLDIYGDVSGWTGGLVNQGNNGYLRATPAVLNNRNVTLYQGSNLVIAGMGDNTSLPERLTTAPNFLTPGNADYNLVVEVLRSDIYPVRATNKTIAITSPIAFAGQTVTVTNNQGFGIELAGPITLNGGVHYSLANATHSSNVVQAGTFSGLITGAGDIIKDGNGSLVLSNPGNTFRGNLISLTAGFIAATSDSALGDPSNQIILNNAGFRAMDTWTSNRVISLVNTNSWIQVLTGKTLTLNTPFGGSPTANLLKEDVGTLVLAAPNPNWLGTLTINQGVVIASNSAALGAGNNTVAIAGGINSAFQLAGGITISQNFNLSTGGNVLNGGVQFTGHLSNASGTNTVTGVVNVNNDSSIGSVAGNLILAGGINLPASKRFQTGGPGTITITGQGLYSTVGAGFNYYQIEHFGTGTIDFQSTNRLFYIGQQGFDNYAGTWKISDGGMIRGANGSWATNYQGATFWLDNTLQAISSRFGSYSGIELLGGRLRYTGNATSFVSEYHLTNNLASSAGNSVVQVDTTAAGTALVFAGLQGNSDNFTLFTAGPTGYAFGSQQNRLIFTTAPTLTNGILPRAIVTDATGTNFASYAAPGVLSAPTGLYGYGSYLTAGSLDAAPTTALFNQATDTKLAGFAQVNALKLSNASVGAFAGLQTLNLSGSGMLLATGNSTIGSGVLLNTGGAIPSFLVAPGATLDVNGSSFNTTLGWHKDLDGTLRFNAQQFAGTAGWTSLQGGNVVLNGGTN